jgi:aspartyl-tRNA(Asn)/glutamyl-tRNA(Gln) amidotransferase subunit C
VSLTSADVEKIALLARLRLTADEIEGFTRQLTQIVDYVESLRALDTQGVEPMAHALDLANVFAADEGVASLDREQALANAPKRDQECYRVPAVLGEESSP